MNFKIGDYVIVNDPTDNDIWMHAFSGQIIEIVNDNTTIVEDGDGDCWAVDFEAMQLNEEEN